MVFTWALVKTVTWGEIDIIKWIVQTGGVFLMLINYKHAGLEPSEMEPAAPAGFMRVLPQEFKLFQMRRVYYAQRLFHHMQSFTRFKAKPTQRKPQQTKSNPKLTQTKPHKTQTKHKANQTKHEAIAKHLFGSR